MNATTFRLDAAVARPGRAFRACALAGVGTGIALAAACAQARGLSGWTFWLATATALAAVGLFLLAVETITGHERLVFFHDEAVAYAATWIVVLLVGYEVMPYLDMAAVTLATIGAFGRVGCLLAGCCHGRPAKTGVRYGHAHIAAGFDASLAGVPLIPVQLIESLAVATTLAALLPLASGARPGTAFVTWLAVYGGVRYVLEFLRGDTWRLSFRGLSHAQWTTVLRAWFAVALLPTVRPAHAAWIPAVAVALTLASVGGALKGRAR